MSDTVIRIRDGKLKLVVGVEGDTTSYTAKVNDTVIGGVWKENVPPSKQRLAGFYAIRSIPITLAMWSHSMNTVALGLEVAWHIIFSTLPEK